MVWVTYYEVCPYDTTLPLQETIKEKHDKRLRREFELVT